MTTPRILWLAIVVIAAASLLFMGVSLWAVSVHRNALKTVARDSAPSIVAAQEMKAALADMDANLANELLGVGSAEESVKAYEQRRRQLGNALVLASENVTFGDAERIPLQTLAIGLGAYERQAQRARDFLPIDRGRALAAYREAAATMSGTLLPAAEELDKANSVQLDKGYENLKSLSSGSRLTVWLTGLILLAVLLWTQTFLSRRTRRTLNPLLVIATIVTFAFLLQVNSSLAAGAKDLKIVKEDSFESIHALWRTLAVSYDAKADDSRYLLDPSNAAAYEQSFLAKSAQIAQVAPGQNYATLAGLANQTLPGDFKGLLADELRNITFPGEQDAAVSSLRDWAAYVNVDDHIRALSRAGKTKEAIALCVGTGEGESNWAFDRFDQSVRATLKINQDAFDAAAASGFHALEGFSLWAPLIAAIVAVLAYFGLIVRIREYSA